VYRCDKELLCCYGNAKFFKGNSDGTNNPNLKYGSLKPQVECGSQVQRSMLGDKKLPTTK